MRAESRTTGQTRLRSEELRRDCCCATKRRPRGADALEWIRARSAEQVFSGSDATLTGAFRLAAGAMAVAAAAMTTLAATLATTRTPTAAIAAAAMTTFAAAFATLLAAVLAGGNRRGGFAAEERLDPAEEAAGLGR